MENAANHSHKDELTSVETEGKTPAEAIEKALALFKVSRKEVKVKILTEEKRGLFGMEGASPAKVRVTLLKKKKLDRQG
jgi:spoIIIJ-associated protein